MWNYLKSKQNRGGSGKNNDKTKDVELTSTSVAEKNNMAQKCDEGATGYLGSGESFFIKDRYSFYHFYFRAYYRN